MTGDLIRRAEDYQGRFAGMRDDLVPSPARLVRDLLAEVARLRSAGYDAFGWQRRCEKSEAERDALLAAVERVKALADAADQRVNASWVYTTEIRRALAGDDDE